MKRQAPDGFWIVPCSFIWAVIILLLLVLSGCGVARDAAFACKAPAIAVHHHAWGDTCFWPGAPRKPAWMS